jgi:branched-chain amino acid transport system substrate-binding protein
MARSGAISARFCRRAAAGGPIKIALIEGLSGPFANTGEAAFRNLLWATERVNARGGVKLPVTASDSRWQSAAATGAL